MYRKGRVLNWWVDSEEYSIIDMEKDVVEHYSWTTNQEALFWYNGSNGQLRRLATDEELLTLLRSSKVVKFIMVVSNKQLGAENDVGELQNDNGRDRELQIIVRENKLPIEVMAENNGLLWAEEPEHGLTAAGPKRAEEEEVEHYMDLGFDACGQWKISGKPCTHVIAFITSRRQVRIEDYVHEYYSVERFKATYQFDINSMVDKAQWPVVDPGFVMVPPKLERPAGRPRVRRIRSSGEAGKRGPYQCKRCFQFGHIEKTCREPPAELGDELPPPPKTQKRNGDAVPHTPKRSNTAKTTASTPPSTGPITRSMAASPSTSTGEGPVTRGMTNISPGGIARRVIIS